MANINCAAMGYDCIFSITAGDDEQDLMLDTVQAHAADKHPELVEDGVLRDDVREKLKNLLQQSGYEHEENK